MLSEAVADYLAQGRWNQALYLFGGPPLGWGNAPGCAFMNM